MAIPNKKEFTIQIMGRDIKVKREIPSQMPGLDGEWNGSNYSIRVNNKLDQHDAVETLVHEILHGILYLSGNTNLLTENTEESIVHALTTALTPHLNMKSLLADNNKKDTK